MMSGRNAVSVEGCAGARPVSSERTRRRRQVLAAIVLLLGAGVWLSLERQPLQSPRAPVSHVRQSPVEAPAYRPAAPPVTLVQAPEGVSPPQPLRPSDGDVSGRVIDALGGPVPFASVTARALSSSESIEISADADGAFRAPVPAGAVELLARAEAFSSALRRLDAPAHDVLLELGPSSVLVGQVVEMGSQVPIADVSVLAMPEQQEALGGALSREPPATARTSPAGEFRMGGLRGGAAYRVWVEDTNWQSEPRSVLVEVGAVNEPARLEASPAAHLTARVLRDGEPKSSRAATLPPWRPRSRASRRSKSPPTRSKSSTCGS